MKRIGASVFAAAVLAPSVAFAQQATITGQVRSASGAPLPSAQVFIQQLNIGGQTNADGSYTLSVPATQATGQRVTIFARRIGFQQDSASVTLTAGASLQQNFTLAEAPTQLQSVVVTALGVEREKSQLGTSVQQLSSEQLNQTRAQSVVNQLQGKVSGVQITGAGTPGGSQKITIRGSSSIMGNNNPLYVVDGIPISNAERGGSTSGGFDYGSAINDLNPDDIESISVLKGPNAAALYGSQATNGAIIITTKRAKAGQMRTEASLTYTWETPSILPKYQNQYGQGNNGEFNFVNGAGGGDNDGEDASWGPRLDVGNMACQFNSPRDETGACVPTPLVSHPNNVKDFFEVGNTLAATVAMSGGTENANARLSVGVDQHDGYIPNSTFKKFSGLLSGQVRPNDRLTVDGSLQYLRNQGLNRPGVGYNVGILEQFIWFGRQVDVKELKNYNQPGTVNGGPANAPYNWNYNYHNNPYWLQYENPHRDTRDRLIGNVAVNYKFTDWLQATARTGSDVFTFDIERQYAQGNLNYTNPAYAGGFLNARDYSNNNNTELNLQANRDLTDRIQLNAMLGGSQQRRTFRTDQVTTRGISAPGIYNPSNAAITPTVTKRDERRQMNSLYASAALTWDGWFTVEGTGRNDWSSTLPEGNNSYFYPSISTSIVLTEALPQLQSEWLSYAKIRGGVTRVGSDANPYSLRPTYAGVSTAFDGRPQFTMGDVLANAELKPEITSASEVGLELELFSGRATFDATYYTKTTKDQIFNIALSPTTGFTSRAINAGKMENKGIEALLSVTPVKLDNSFEWTTTFNYSRNRNQLVELTEGIEALSLGSLFYATIQARVGEPYGAIYAQDFKYDEATGKVLTKDGLWVHDAQPKVVGNIQPDWTGGWSNDFRYKNFSLGALLDIRVGGDIMSVSNFFGDYAGITKASLKGRENNWNDSISIDGIDVDTNLPNTTKITAQEYWQSIFPVMAPYVYDGGFVKLREVRLGFDVPAEWAQRLSASNMRIALTGRNLWANTNVPNIDPEFSYTIGNYQGLEFAALPNARSFGISINFTP